MRWGDAMMGTVERYGPRARDYAACYGLVALLVPVAYLLLVVWIDTVRSLAVLLPDAWDLFGLRAFVMYGYLFVALVSFIAILAAEGYLREGVERSRRRKNELRRRFARLVVPMLGALALGLAVQGIAGFLGRWVG